MLSESVLNVGLNHYLVSTCGLLKTPKPSRRPTPGPTRMPSPNPLKTTVQNVQLIFKNASAGYALSPEKRASLIRYLNQMLSDQLDQAFELLEVKYAGVLLHTTTRRKRRSLADNYSPQLPIMITVQAPEDASDFALTYILQIILDNLSNLEGFLQTLDGAVFVVSSFSEFIYI